ADVTWQAFNVPAGWTVTIDADNVVTIVAPADDVAPAEITFEATFHWEPIDCIDSAIATFYPNRPPVADAGKDYYSMGEYYEVLEGRTVELDGSNSYDPDDDELISYDWDLNEDGTFETPSADGFTTFSAAGYDAGAKRIRMYVFLKVVDEHGAENIAQARVQIYDQAPTAAFISPSAPQPDGTTVHFTDQSTSEVDDIVSWAWDFGGLGSSTDRNPIFTFMDDGDHNVCLTVTDDDGSTNTACNTVTVINLPPVALTKNITVELNDLGDATITATDIDNGSHDLSGIESLSVSPSSFTCANVGPNLVTLTVTDNNGNVSTTPATVTVEDNVPSVVLTQDFTVLINPDGTASITAGNIDNGSNDACGIASLSVNPSSFSCGDLGANTVTLTATDVNGNASTATATVTVADTSFDFDGDGSGNFCDDDDDDDGVLDPDDQCPETALNAPVDSTGCSIEQICVCTDKRNSHGKYVRCVVRTSKRFRDAGLIDWRDFSRYTSAAARSTCGRKRIFKRRWN
ncbi:MAG: PKD domain-containing protein, partial [Candidatus Electrothrix sp. AR4]|nr:PKD domain-containing protein [Candidatus Electrothrix sp. AR4]